MVFPLLAALAAPALASAVAPTLAGLTAAGTAAAAAPALAGLGAALPATALGAGAALPTAALGAGANAATGIAAATGPGMAALNAATNPMIVGETAGLIPKASFPMAAAPAARDMSAVVNMAQPMGQVALGSGNQFAFGNTAAGATPMATPTPAFNFIDGVTTTSAPGTFGGAAAAPSAGSAASANTYGLGAATPGTVAGAMPHAGAAGGPGASESGGLLGGLLGGRMGNMGMLGLYGASELLNSIDWGGDKKKKSPKIGHAAGEGESSAPMTGPGGMSSSAEYDYGVPTNYGLGDVASTKKMAAGGAVESEKDVLSRAIDAIDGNDPQPEIALAQFVKTYGRVALRKLVDAVYEGQKPSRNGAVIDGPGGPMDDLVPAEIEGTSEDVLLSPGEFVMSNDAVKGAGGGSETAGIDALYSLMADLEVKPAA